MDKFKKIAAWSSGFTGIAGALFIIWNVLVGPAFGQYVLKIADRSTAAQFASQKEQLKELQKQTQRTFIELQVAREKQKGLVESTKQIREDNKQMLQILLQWQASRP